MPIRVPILRRLVHVVAVLIVDDNDVVLVVDEDVVVDVIPHEVIHDEVVAPLVVVGVHLSRVPFAGASGPAVASDDIVREGVPNEVVAVVVVEDVVRKNGGAVGDAKRPFHAVTTGVSAARCLGGLR